MKEHENYRLFHGTYGTYETYLKCGKCFTVYSKFWECSRRKFYDPTQASSCTKQTNVGYPIYVCFLWTKLQAEYTKKYIICKTISRMTCRNSIRCSRVSCSNISIIDSTEFRLCVQICRVMLRTKTEPTTLTRKVSHPRSSFLCP